MNRIHTIVLVVGAFVLGAALLGTAGQAAAAPRIIAKMKLSGPMISPCWPAAASGPHAAVDPSNPSRVAVVYSLGDQTAEAVATTRDGGRTWSRTVMPGMSPCSGGPWGVVGDPFVSIGAGGRVAATGGWVSMDPAVGLDEAGVRVYLGHSDDGGSSFADPVEPEPKFGAERGVVSFAPGSNDDLLVAFERLHYLNGDNGGYLPSGAGRLGIARSADGGATFGPATDVLPPQPNEELTTVGLLRSGAGVALVGSSVTDTAIANTVLSRFGPDAGIPLDQTVFAVRSDANGLVWTLPQTIGVFSAGCCIPDAAAGQDGSLLTVWPGRLPGGVDLARSDDGGANWSKRTVQLGMGAISQPAVAERDGTIAILFYEQGGALLTPKLATSQDGGNTWSSLPLAKGFNPAAIKGGSSDGSPMGPYQDLVPVPGGFAAAVTVGGDGGTEDVWWLRTAGS